MTSRSSISCSLVMMRQQPPHASSAAISVSSSTQLWLAASPATQTAFVRGAALDLECIRGALLVDLAVEHTALSSLIALHTDCGRMKPLQSRTTAAMLLEVLRPLSATTIMRPASESPAWCSSAPPSLRKASPPRAWPTPRRACRSFSQARALRLPLLRLPWPRRFCARLQLQYERLDRRTRPRDHRRNRWSRWSWIWFSRRACGSSTRLRGIPAP